MLYNFRCYEFSFRAEKSYNKSIKLRPFQYFDFFSFIKLIKLFQQLKEATQEKIKN